MGESRAHNASFTAQSMTASLSNKFGKFKFITGKFRQCKSTAGHNKSLLHCGHLLLGLSNSAHRVSLNKIISTLKTERRVAGRGDRKCGTMNTRLSEFTVVPGTEREMEVIV